MGTAAFRMAAVHIVLIIGRQIVAEGRYQIWVCLPVNIHLEGFAGAPSLLHAGCEEMVQQLVVIISKGFVQIRIVIRIINRIEDQGDIFGNGRLHNRHRHCRPALLLIPAAGLQPVLILLLRRQSAADVAFCLINVQNNTRFSSQDGVDVDQAVGDICWCIIRNENYILLNISLLRAVYILRIPAVLSLHPRML